jgi:hypothetical protein
MFNDVCFPIESPSTEVTTEFQSRSPQFLCGQNSDFSATLLDTNFPQLEHVA